MRIGSSDDLISHSLARSRTTNEYYTIQLLRFHGDAEVDHADNLEDREDDEGSGGSQSAGDDREEEGDGNIQNPHQDVGNRSTLVNKLRGEILGSHDEEERTRTAFKTKDEENHTNDGNDAQALVEEAHGDGDGTEKHDA